MITPVPGRGGARPFFVAGPGGPGDDGRMRRVPGDGPDEAKRWLQAFAQEQAGLLVPRPGYPIYGLSAPAFESARVSGYSTSQGEWRSVVLSYGPLADDDEVEPRVRVTTLADGDGVVSRGGSERSPDAVSEQEVENVTVRVETWGVHADEIRVAPVPDLRPVIEAALEQTLARIERLRRAYQPPPRPDFPPAETA